MNITVGWLAGSAAAIYQANSLFLSFKTYLFLSVRFFFQQTKKELMSPSPSPSPTFVYFMSNLNFCTFIALTRITFPKFIRKTHFAKWLYPLCYGLKCITTHQHIRLTVYTCRIASRRACARVYQCFESHFPRCNRNFLKTARWPPTTFSTWRVWKLPVPHIVRPMRSFLKHHFCTPIIPLPHGPPAPSSPFPLSLTICLAVIQHNTHIFCTFANFSLYFCTSEENIHHMGPLNNVLLRRAPIRSTSGPSPSIRWKRNVKKRKGVSSSITFLVWNIVKYIIGRRGP